MEAVKIPEKPATITWDYDEETVVGLTLIGLRARITRGLITPH